MSQARTCREGRARHGLDVAGAGVGYGQERHGRAEGIRGSGPSAIARRTARATNAVDAAAVVWGVPPGHTNAGLPRRRAAPVPALQGTAARCANGRMSHLVTWEILVCESLGGRLTSQGGT